MILFAHRRRCGAISTCRSSPASRPRRGSRRSPGDGESAPPAGGGTGRGDAYHLGDGIVSNIVNSTTSGSATGGRLPDLAILGDGPAAEAFRTLRANINFAGGDHPARVVLLADAGVGEVRPTIAANLAVALAQAGDTTLLIDADLRRPSQHAI